MQFNTRQLGKTGRWLKASVAASLLAGTPMLAQPPQTPAPMPTPAAPQPAPSTAQPTPPPPPSDTVIKPVPERRVKFEFDNKRWGEVLTWLSDQTGLPFIGSLKPQGSFTYIAPKGSVGAKDGYTIPEVIDILNEALQQQKMQLIRRESSYTIVDAGQQIDPVVVARLTVEEVLNGKDRGNSEIVSTVLPLKSLVAEDIAAEVKRQMGPFGEVTALAKSNQLVLLDSVKNLRTVIKTIQDQEQAEGGQTDSYSHVCVYIKARDADRVLRDLMGDPRVLLQLQIAQQREQAQRDREGRQQGGGSMAQAIKKERMFYITADERTNTVLISGAPDRIQQAKKILKEIDVPSPGGKKVVVDAPMLKTFEVASGSATDLENLLREMYKTSNTIRVRAIGTNKVMIFAPPDDLLDIAKIIEGNDSGSGTVVKLLPVVNLDATDIASTLKNMFPHDLRTQVGPVIEADGPRNAIRVKGTREQIADIEMAMKAIDVAGGTGNTITLERGSAAALANELQRILGATRGIPVKVITPTGAPKPAKPDSPPMPPPGSGNGGGEPPQIQDPQAGNQPQQPKIDPNAKPVTITAVGNRLIINSDDPATTAYIRELVRLMTQPGAEGEFETIRLTTANATDAARVIDEFFNGPKQPQGGLGGGGGRGGMQAMMQAMQANAAAQNAGASAANKVRVVADPASNTLLVRASQLEMLTVRELVKALEGEDVQPAQKTHTIKLEHATASEVASVIESVYRDLTASGQRGGGGFRFGRFGGFQSNRNDNRDANGNIRPSQLSIGVDERSNNLIVLCSDALFKDVSALAKELDDEAAGSRKTYKVIPIKGIDPYLVEQAVQAFQGNRTPINRSNMNQGGGFQGGFQGGGGNRFGNQGGGFGMPSGAGIGTPFGGSNFQGGGNRGGGGFQGGGNRGGMGGSNFQGGAMPASGSFQGGGNRGGFQGGGMQGGGFQGGGGNRGFQGGGGGNRGGGRGGGPGGFESEPGGPDFFEHGVKDDPQPSQLFDPQHDLVARRPETRNVGGSEEQQQPMPPGGQPQPATQPTPAPGAQPAPPAGTIEGIQQPRRPISIEVLPELGGILISGENPADVAAIENLIEAIRKIAPGTEAEIRIVQLHVADATYVANTAGLLFQRINSTPSGNLLVGGASRPGAPAPTAVALGAAPSTNNALFLPLPRFNAIAVVAQKGRMEEIVKEIAKLDQKNAAIAGMIPFPLKKASAQQVANIIVQLYSQRYPNETTLQNQIRITFDVSTNTIFVQAAPADLEEIKGLIDRLDSSSSAAVNDLRIVRLNNALADELANTIMQSITAGVAGAAPTTPGAQPGALPGAAGAIRPVSGVATKSTSLRFFSGRPGMPPIDAGVLEDVHVTSDIRTNSLIIAATPRTMDLILALVRELDAPAAAQSTINVFTLRKADAVQTATLLQQLFLGSTTGIGTGAGAGVAGGLAQGFAPQAGAAPAGGLARPILNLGGETTPGQALIDLRFGVDNRTNSIIVAGSRGDMEVIETIIFRLEDANVQSRQSQVYRLRNAVAADVANALQTFVTNALSVPRTAQQVTSFQEMMRDVVIIPEPVSNTLLISATPSMFTDLYRLIEQIDSMPPQVAIQVMVAEVTLDDDQEFGVEFGLQSPILFQRSILPGAVVNSGAPNFGVPGFNFNTTNPLPNSSNLGSGIVGYQGLGNLNVGRSSPNGNFGGFIFAAQSDSFSLLIRALKTQQRLDVLSCPQVMTLDNQTAAVSVGQDIPIVAQSQITANGLVNTSIDRRNVGVLLRVTPRITPEGKVLMRVFPEVSSVIPQPVQLGNGIQSTAFNIQQVETTCVAQDGETVVIGGMIQQRDLKTENKIPALGDLPYIGAAFRYRTQVREKKELLVILTPHIVRSQADADRILAREARRMDWLINDVNRLHGPADLYKLNPQYPPQPATRPLPAVLPPNGPACLPGGEPVVPGLPVDAGPMPVSTPQQGEQTAPQIPYGPLTPLLGHDPAVPLPPARQPAPQQPQQQPPAGGPVTPPVMNSQYQSMLPQGALIPQAAPEYQPPTTVPGQPAPQQQSEEQQSPPQGKDSRTWRLFRRN